MRRDEEFTAYVAAPLCAEAKRELQREGDAVAPVGEGQVVTAVAAHAEGGKGGRPAQDLVALQLAGLQRRADVGEIPDVMEEALAELQRSVSGAGFAFGHAHS